MSHQHTVIDLADGLTVLTGPNNCGKSAVVAALQILASNGKTTHVMRHGAKECKITAETDDGHVICWRRKKASVSYTLDGEDIHRVGQSVPDGLHKLLRMPVVEADAGKTRVSYDIHFGEQKSPVFLLGDPGSRAASFFAAASDASRLLEMTVNHRSNVKENRQAARRLTGELATAAGELLRLSPLEELEKKVAEAEQQFAEFETLKKAVLRARRLTHDIYEAEAIEQRFHNEIAAMRSLGRPPEQHDTSKLITMIDGICRTVADQRVAIMAIDACRVLETPPKMEATSECRWQLDELKSWSSRCKQLQAEAHAFRQFDDPPAVHATTELRRMIRAFQQVKLERSRTAEDFKLLAALEVPTQPHDTTSLKRLCDELIAEEVRYSAALNVAGQLSDLPLPAVGANDSTADLAESIRLLVTAENDLTALRKETETRKLAVVQCEQRVRDFVEENPRCNTCGAELAPEQLMAAVPGLEGHEHV